MSGPGIDERLSRETLEQHQQIGFFLGRLEQSLAALDPDGEVDQLRDLVAQLESFKERLEEHHHHEETVVFQGIADLLEEAEGQILTLTAQHERMIEILEMACIHARNDDASEIPALQEDLATFISTIRQHERMEEALMQQALRSIAPS